MNKIVKIVWKNKWVGMALAVIILAVWMPLVKSDPASYQSGLEGGVNTEYMNVTYLRAPTSAGSTIVVASSTSYNNYHANFQCDGTADEVQINYAIENCTDGGTIRLLDGLFTLADSIVLHNNISLIGLGIGATKVTLANSADCNVIENESATSGTVNVTIADIYINGNGGNQAATSNAIFINSSTNAGKKVTVRNIFVENIALQGIHIKGVNNTLISNCYVDNTGVQSAFGNGIYLLRCNNLAISNCISIHGGGHGIKVGGATETFGNGTITGCITNYCGDNGIGVYGSIQSIAVTGCTSCYNGDHGIYIGNEISTYPYYIAVSGCVFNANLQRGVYINRAYQVTISGCSIGNNQYEGIKGIDIKYTSITGNSIVENSQNGAGNYDGINLTTHDDQVREIAIVGNICEGTNHNINIHSTGNSDRVLVVGNIIRIFNGSAISLVGANNTNANNNT